MGSPNRVLRRHKSAGLVIAAALMMAACQSLSERQTAGIDDATAELAEVAEQLGMTVASTETLHPQYDDIEILAPHGWSELSAAPAAGKPVLSIPEIQERLAPLGYAIVKGSCDNESVLAIFASPSDAGLKVFFDQEGSTTLNIHVDMNGDVVRAERLSGATASPNCD